MKTHTHKNTIKSKKPSKIKRIEVEKEWRGRKIWYGMIKGSDMRRKKVGKKNCKKLMPSSERKRGGIQNG